MASNPKVQYLRDASKRSEQSISETKVFDLIGSLAATYERCIAIATKKNADYAGLADPFANFQAAPALLSGISVEKGILVRLTDKIKRIDNLLSHEAYVTEESMNDTIEDAINYLGILKAWRECAVEQSSSESSRSEP
jgi:hypothetical protein